MRIRAALTKQERISAFLNQWDPAGEYQRTGDFRAYIQEAEDIAEKVRSNSKIETVEKLIAEVLSTEGLNERELRFAAECILAAVKTR